jgi:hypothetical protein
MAAHTEFLLPGKFFHVSAEVYSDAAVLLLDVLTFFWDAATPAGTAVVSFAGVVFADSGLADLSAAPESVESV